MCVCVCVCVSTGSSALLAAMLQPHDIGHYITWPLTILTGWKGKQHKAEGMQDDWVSHTFTIEAEIGQLLPTIILPHNHCSHTRTHTRTHTQFRCHGVVLCS